MYSLLTRKATDYITTHLIPTDNHIHVIDDVPFVCENNKPITSIEYSINASSNKLVPIKELMKIYATHLTIKVESTERFIDGHYTYKNINDHNKILSVDLEWGNVTPYEHYNAFMIFKFNNWRIIHEKKRVLLLLFLDPLLFIKKMKPQIKGSNVEDFFMTLKYNINKKVANTNTSFLLINELRHILVADILDIIIRLYICVL